MNLFNKKNERKVIDGGSVFKYRRTHVCGVIEERENFSLNISVWRQF